MSADALQRMLDHWCLDAQDVCAIVLFGFGHPEHSFSRLVLDFARGIGPAAVARGVAGVHRRPVRPVRAVAPLRLVA